MNTANKYQQKIQSLESKIASLQKDKARLDWLDTHKTGPFEEPYWKIYAKKRSHNIRQSLDYFMELYKDKHKP